MGTAGHYLNLAIVACKCGHLHTEDKLGLKCDRCNTVAEPTTATEYYKNPLPCAALSPTYELSDEQLERLIEFMLSVDSGDAIINKLMLIEEFEDVTGIRPYKKGKLTSDDIAVPIVMHTAASQIDAYSPRARIIMRLLDEEVPEKANMSITDLLNLPTEDLKLIMDACMAISRRKTKDLSALIG